MTDRPGDPITKQRSPWVEDARERADFGVPMRWFRRQVGDGLLLACVSDEPVIGWHLSISFRDRRGRQSRYPTWDEIAHARYELLPHELDFVMHLPPPAEFVSIHATTFHLHQHPEPGDR